MTILILDTSQTTSYAGICQKGLLQKNFALFSLQALSSTYVPQLDALFDLSDVKMEELSAIAVGIGPGSYTGIRVAATIAKSLSYALEIPLIPYISLLGFIPEAVNGSFTFYYPTKGAQPYTCCGTKAKQELIAGKPEKHLDTTSLAFDVPKLTTLHPELLHTPFTQAELNLPLLCTYVYQKLLNQNLINHNQLHSLSPVYLQEHTLAESLLTYSTSGTDYH